MGAVTVSRAAFPIGELSRLTGVNIETIRYYERIMMVPPPPRTAGGRRIYGPIQVRKVKFIRRSRELGFTLNEIRNLLDLAEGSHACAKVKAVTVSHLEDVCRKISDLQQMERALVNTVNLCEGGDTTHCPILDVLSG